MKRLVLMVDGGHVGGAARREGMPYGPDFIEAFARNCALADEELVRVLYYDCAPYQGHHTLPVSGSQQVFASPVSWLDELARRDLIAVKLGSVRFNGYCLKRSALPGKSNLTDADFRPDFERIGIDLQIGMDVASYASLESVHAMAFVTANPAHVAAMQFARRSGVEVVLVRLPAEATPSELLEHADSVRTIGWP